MTPVERVLELLDQRGLKTKKLHPDQWEAQCPAHDDHTSSLSVGESADLKCLLNCHAGCTLEAITGALGISAADLFPSNGYKKWAKDQIVAAYDYHDQDGTLLYQVVKKAGKQFMQRRPNGQGDWIWNLHNTTRVPYRLPELIAAIADGKAIFIVEGEKDADRLRTLDLAATTLPGGAGKWKSEYARWFADAGRVYILPDNDQPGRSHARDVATALAPTVGTVKVVTLPDLPPKGDISDWLDNGHTINQLRQLVKDTPGWQPVDDTNLDQILTDVYDWFGRFVSYPTEHDQLAHTLWAAHTHAMDSWNSTPRLAFLSPEPASGKTRALEVTEPIVPNPVNAVNVTPAYLFRKVGEDGPLPTILYDEIDTVFGPKAKDNEEIRGLINAGHRRGAVAGRCVVVGKTIKTEEIPAYSAVALAGLGEIPDTILTRSIVIPMRRRAPGETVEPYRPRINVPQGEELRDRLTSALGKIRQVLTDAWPQMPAGIEDRDADKWEPLLAIADAAGGDWPNRARIAVTTLVALSKQSTPSLGIRLLEDIKTIYGNQEALTTEMILKGLTDLDEAPWGDLYGKALNARGLAQRLAKYSIPKSRTVRINDILAKGHPKADFTDAWARYLTPNVSDVSDVSDSKGGDPTEVDQTPTSSNTSISLNSSPQGGKDTSDTSDTKQPCNVCEHPIPGAHHYWCPDISDTPDTNLFDQPDPADLPDPYEED